MFVDPYAGMTLVDIPEVTETGFEPLEAFAAEHPGIDPAQFMLMGVQPSEMHLYKHVDTRRYLNLNREGTACFRYVPALGEGHYVLIGADEALRNLFA